MEIKINKVSRFTAERLTQHCDQEWGVVLSLRIIKENVLQKLLKLTTDPAGKEDTSTVFSSSCIAVVARTGTLKMGID